MYELLSECPICKKHSAALVSISAIRSKHLPHFAFCRKCNTRTKTYNNAGKAIAAWNSIAAMLRGNKK